MSEAGLRLEIDGEPGEWVETVAHAEDCPHWQDQPYDSPPVYYFQHTLGDILSQCISHGLRIRHFYEHPLDLSGGRYSSSEDIKLPLSFSLVAQKEGQE